MGIRVTHPYGEHLAVAAADGTEILRYVYRPDPEPFEARKPYAHPVRTGHRMVQGGDLRVTVLMQNSGLPEAGDAVFTFPPEVLADPERYAAAATLPFGAGPETATAARRRGDLAVEGYLALREALTAGDGGPYRAVVGAGLVARQPAAQPPTRTRPLS